MSERKSSERVDIRIWVLTLALVLNLVFPGYRIAVTSKATFNSDSATTSLYAGEILKSGRLIPPDWHFNNGDVWLYNHTLFAVPLLTMLPNGYTLYAASTGIFALLIVLAIALAMRALSAGRLAMLAAAAVLASGISSPFIADLVYDWGATYGSQFLL